MAENRPAEVQLALFGLPADLNEVVEILERCPGLEVDVPAVAEILDRFPQGGVGWAYNGTSFNHRQAAHYAAMCGYEPTITERDAARLLFTAFCDQEGPCLVVDLPRPSRHRTMRQCIEWRRHMLRLERMWARAEAARLQAAGPSYQPGTGDSVLDVQGERQVWTRVEKEWNNVDCSMEYHNVLHGLPTHRDDQRDVECALARRARAQRGARPRGHRTRVASRRSSARSGDPPGDDEGLASPPPRVFGAGRDLARPLEQGSLR